MADTRKKLNPSTEEELQKLTQQLAKLGEALDGTSVEHEALDEEVNKLSEKLNEGIIEPVILSITSQLKKLCLQYRDHSTWWFKASHNDPADLMLSIIDEIQNNTDLKTNKKAWASALVTSISALDMYLTKKESKKFLTALKVFQHKNEASPLFSFTMDYPLRTRLFLQFIEAPKDLAAVQTLIRHYAESNNPRKNMSLTNF